ncbi:MAG: hypothetical protein P8J89_06725 [Phycisphaerales bacterium]|nr:hypothetical protein [Phycisphaerales bacterium]
MTDSDLSQQQHRRAVLVDVLREQDVHSQGDLVNLMNAQGMPVDQATLSRDLRSMGVSKGPSGYQAPDSKPVDRAARKRLSLLLGEHLVGMSPSGTILVLRVTPGYASSVAVEVDQIGLAGLEGTIAGRDTVFLAFDSDVGLRRIRSELVKLARGV